MAVALREDAVLAQPEVREHTGRQRFVAVAGERIPVDEHTAAGEYPPGHAREGHGVSVRRGTYAYAGVLKCSPGA